MNQTHGPPVSGRYAYSIPEVARAVGVGRSYIYGEIREAGSASGRRDAAP